MVALVSILRRWCILLLFPAVISWTCLALFLYNTSVLTRYLSGYVFDWGYSSQLLHSGCAIRDHCHDIILRWQPVFPNPLLHHSKIYEVCVCTLTVSSFLSSSLIKITTILFPLPFSFSSSSFVETILLIVVGEECAMKLLSLVPHSLSNELDPRYSFEELSVLTCQTCIQFLLGGEDAGKGRDSRTLGGSIASFLGTWPCWACRVCYSDCRRLHDLFYQ